MADEPCVLEYTLTPRDFCELAAAFGARLRGETLVPTLWYAGSLAIVAVVVAGFTTSWLGPLGAAGLLMISWMWRLWRYWFIRLPDGTQEVAMRIAFHPDRVEIGSDRHSWTDYLGAVESEQFLMLEFRCWITQGGGKVMLPIPKAALGYGEAVDWLARRPSQPPPAPARSIADLVAPEPCVATVAYELSPDDMAMVRAGQVNNVREAPWHKHAFWILYGGGLVWMFFFFDGFQTMPSLEKAFLATVIIAVPAYTLLGMRLPSIVAEPTEPAQFSVALTRTGLAFAVGESLAVIPWKDIASVSPEEGWLVFRRGDQIAVVIPARAVGGLPETAYWEGLANDLWHTARDSNAFPARVPTDNPYQSPGPDF